MYEPATPKSSTSINDCNIERRKPVVSMIESRRVSTTSVKKEEEYELSGWDHENSIDKN